MALASRWLLVVPALQRMPARVRLTPVARLRRLGAIRVRPSVFVLPDSPATREAVGWLKADVERSNGELTAFAADSVDAWTDERIVEEFRRTTQSAYARLAQDLEGTLAQPARSTRPGAQPGRRRLDRFLARAADIERLDFFGSAGRDRVRALVADVRERLSSGTSRTDGRGVERGAYRGRHWVTLPRPGADRMASAWLIRRFVDPEATFGFAPNTSAVAHDAVAFDMFGVELSHRGDECTFETLRDRFGVRNDGVEHLARLVHDLDLKDGRYEAPAAATLGPIIEGLQLAEADDRVLLAHGMVLFEGLYQSVSRSAPFEGTDINEVAARDQASGE
jgi:hypothetical protein